MSFGRNLFGTGLAVLLVACGGGGGGSSGGGQVAAVSIASHAPALLEVTEYEGRSHGAALQVTLSGDLASLSGKTVYVVADVPGPVLTETPQITVYGTQPRADVLLSTRTGNTIPAGVYEGTAVLHACLDPDCKVEFGNSPVSVPYKVTILPSLRVAQAAVQRDVDFGSPSDTQRIAVSLPPGTIEWSVGGPDTTDGAYTVSKAADGSANVEVVFAVAAPGTRGGTYQIDAIVPRADGSGLQTMQAWLEVSYTVRPGTGPAIAFDPASGNHTLAAQVGAGTRERIRLVSRDGTVQRIGPVYLTAPAAAAGNALVHDWIHVDSTVLNDYGVTTCTSPGDTPVVCLPIGTYTGAIRYRHTTPGGVQSAVDFPISLTVTPGN